MGRSPVVALHVDNRRLAQSWGVGKGGRVVVVVVSSVGGGQRRRRRFVGCEEDGSAVVIRGGCFRGCRLCR